MCKNENQQIAKKFYNMKLHDKIMTHEFKIIRVIGGWIYQNTMGSTFVPFNNEFR